MALRRWRLCSLQRADKERTERHLRSTDHRRSLPLSPLYPFGELTMIIIGLRRGNQRQCSYCEAMADRGDITEIEVSEAALSLQAPDFVQVSMCEDHARTVAADILSALRSAR